MRKALLDDAYDKFRLQLQFQDSNHGVKNTYKKALTELTDGKPCIEKCNMKDETNGKENLCSILILKLRKGNICFSRSSRVWI